VDNRTATRGETHEVGRDRWAGESQREERTHTRQHMLAFQQHPHARLPVAVAVRRCQFSSCHCRRGKHTDTLASRRVLNTAWSNIVIASGEITSAIMGV
jgi:hypothetical protein